MRSVTILATLVMACSISLGQTSSSTADKIEEDWEVVIASPSPTEVGPQITTCMSPVSDNSTPFVAFDMNYRDVQTFQPGGLQVNVYSDGNALTSSTQGDELCQTSNETISWTQRMTISDGNTVTYTIVDGQSTTWGQFGQDQGLDPVSFSSSITSLSSYSPDTSVAKSGVGWQSNRVSKMRLLRVRYYNGDQLISTDNSPRSVTLSVTSGQ
jgi:hypothetical protein